MMNIRRLIHFACGLFLGFCFLFPYKLYAQKPNIVFVLADDLTRWDIGPYGSKDAITPAMDKLAEEGIKFNKAYQAAPMCSPTRHNLLTGIYPVRTGAYPNHTYAKEGTKSIVHYLKELNYRVAYSGKRHVLTKEVFPFEYLDGKDDFKERDPEFDKVEAFLNDASTKDENFALFINSTAPHAPWVDGDRSLFDKNKIKLPPYLADTEEVRENFRNYLAEINYLDNQLKTVLDLLEKYGQTENTVVFFCTEQGNSMPFAKWTLYNAGIGTGLIVKWPGMIKPGSESSGLVELSDIVPTMIDIAGGEAVEGLDGASLIPVMKGEKKSHKEYTFALQTTRTIYSGSQYFPIRSVSDGKYHLILNLTPEVKFSNLITERDQYFDDWRKSDNPEHVQLAGKYEYRPPVELYDDEEDPYNLENLADDPDYKQIKERLHQKLLEWMEYCGDEGIKTELMADVHNREKLQPLPVMMHMEFSEPVQDGNFEAERKGYYFFYVNRDDQIKINGKSLRFGHHQEGEFSDYGVVALKKGMHRIEYGKTKEIAWSGPDFNKKPFEQ